MAKREDKDKQGKGATDPLSAFIVDQANVLSRQVSTHTTPGGKARKPEKRPAVPPAPPKPLNPPLPKK